MVVEKQEDVASEERSTRENRPHHMGLSPTVERMFGALVVEADEDREGSSPELGIEGAGQTGS